MPYPTTRALNERLNERKHPPKTSHRKHNSQLPSPPFSPRRALEQTKQSKLPVAISPTSALHPSEGSPQKAPQSSKAATKLARDATKSEGVATRPQLKRADDSWLRKKVDAAGNTSSPTKPAEVKSMHTWKRSGTVPAQSTIPPEALVMLPRKRSELPDTLLRRHVLARDSQTQSKSGSVSSIPVPTSPQKPSPDTSSPLRQTSVVHTMLTNPTSLSSSPTKPKLPRGTAPPSKFEHPLTPPKTNEASRQETPQPDSPTLPGHTCTPKGHPFRSCYLPYLCISCAEASQNFERERRQRLDEFLHDDVLVERIKLQDWQWKIKFNPSPKTVSQAKDKSETKPSETKSAVAGSAEAIATSKDKLSRPRPPKLLLTSVAGADEILPLPGDLAEQKRLKAEAHSLLSSKSAPEERSKTLCPLSLLAPSCPQTPHSATTSTLSHLKSPHEIAVKELAERRLLTEQAERLAYPHSPDRIAEQNRLKEEAANMAAVLAKMEEANRAIEVGVGEAATRRSAEGEGCEGKNGEGVNKKGDEGKKKTWSWGSTSLKEKQRWRVSRLPGREEF